MKRKHRTIRVKLQKDGTAVLIGVPFDDLRSILTAASLYRYDTLDKCEKKLQEVRANPVSYLHGLDILNTERDLRWNLAHFAMIKRIEKAVETNYGDFKSPDFRPVSTLKRHEIASRFSRVRQERQSRLRMEHIMANIDQIMEKRRASLASDL